MTGNPVREEFLHAPTRASRFEHLDLDPDVPLLVATGGGTGALGLNRLVAAAAPRLVDQLQVVHLTGRGRGVPRLDRLDALSLDRVPGRRDAAPAGRGHAGGQPRRAWAR